MENQNLNNIVHAGKFFEPEEEIPEGKLTPAENKPSDVKRKISVLPAFMEQPQEDPIHEKVDTLLEGIEEKGKETKSNSAEDRIFAIDRSTSFNPVTFIGENWKIEEQDQRSLSVTEVNFNKVSFETCLKTDETVITGEEKIKRLGEANHVLADAKIGQALYEEEGQKTLEYLYKEKGITQFELLGTILRSPGDNLCVLYLHREGAQWYWNHCCFDCDRGADCPSLVLAST